jgi:hypothetical protein
MALKTIAPLEPCPTASQFMVVLEAPPSICCAKGRVAFNTVGNGH